MRLWQVLWNQISTPFIDFLLFANDSDSFSTTWARRLKDVHVFIIVQLSVIAPSLIVFWKEVSVWAYLEVFPMSPPLPLHIPPQVALVSNVPRPSEVIDLLKRVHVLEFAWSYQACPQTVPCRAIAQSKASKFESIYHTVVGVGRVIDPESQSGKGLEVFLSELLDSIVFVGSLNFQERRVVEKDGGWSACYRSVLKCDDVVWGPTQECLFERSIFSFFVY